MTVVASSINGRPTMYGGTVVVVTRKRVTPNRCVAAAMDNIVSEGEMEESTLKEENEKRVKNSSNNNNNNNNSSRKREVEKEEEE